MEERLRHRRLIHTLNPPIKPKIPRHKRHLDKRIRAEAAILRDPTLSEARELECLHVVLADQVRKTRFGEADADEEGGSEGPFEFTRDGDEVLWRWRGGFGRFERFTVW